MKFREFVLPALAVYVFAASPSKADGYVTSDSEAQKVGHTSYLMRIDVLPVNHTDNKQDGKNKRLMPREYVWRRKRDDKDLEESFILSPVDF